MIADQKIGKSFMGALGYNLKKLDLKNERLKAVLLDSNFGNLDRKQIQAEVDLIRQLRPALNKYVYHTSLNFTKQEEHRLNDKMLLEIAHEYLNGMGFNNNQYLIFRHYDADHPHLHLLVNRITFDGDLVSDSNNYKRSEAILRRLERKYQLTEVAPSRESKNRAASKDELEMMVRTGQLSSKAKIQLLLTKIGDEHNKRNPGQKMRIADFITAGEKAGINFLFNIAKTGRISGITYFHEGFKITGQALGKQFKWTELNKLVSYDQLIDMNSVSSANNLTKSIIDETNTSGLLPAKKESDGLQSEQIAADVSDTSDTPIREQTWRSAQNAELFDVGIENEQLTDYHSPGTFSISHDVDDEATHGKERRRRRGR